VSLLVNLNPFALSFSSYVVLSKPFSVVILNLPFIISILFLAVMASLKECILKVPSFIRILPRLSLSESSG